MRSLLMSSMLVVCSSCGGGVSPELYAVIADFFTLPDSCFLNNAQPSQVTVSGAPLQTTFQVWDGPDGALLDIETPRVIDMGDAPSVTIGGIVKGKRATSGWTFSTETVSRNTTGGRTLTNTAKVELNFDRANSFKGTATLQSSTACSGTSCAAMLPSCNVTGITLTGTRLQVAYERSP